MSNPLFIASSMATCWLGAAFSLGQGIEMDSSSMTVWLYLLGGAGLGAGGGFLPKLIDALLGKMSSKERIRVLEEERAEDQKLKAKLERRLRACEEALGLAKDEATLHSVQGNNAKIALKTCAEDCPHAQAALEILGAPPAED